MWENNNRRSNTIHKTITIPHYPSNPSNHIAATVVWYAAESGTCRTRDVLTPAGGSKILAVLGQTSSNSESALITFSSAITWARSSRSTRRVTGIEEREQAWYEIKRKAA